MHVQRFCAGVAITSGASLALSLLFTRIFSVTMYYHFAFLLVSLALLGVAVSGVAVYLLPGIFTAERRPWLAGAFAVLVAPLTYMALRVAIENPLSVQLDADNISRLMKLYVATALPFLATGFSITLAISGAGAAIGRIYAYDLVGAALGCIVVVPVLSWIGGPAAVLSAGALAAIGGATMASAAIPQSAMRKFVIVTGMLAAVSMAGLIGLQLKNGDLFRFQQGSKFLVESAVEFEAWNAFSRVTVSSAGPTDHKWIHIDADAATRMYSADVAKDNYSAPRRFSETKVAALVYALRHEGPSLVIGPGGGPDVMSALRSGTSRVVAVEVNPVIGHVVMREKYAAYNGDLYHNPRVQLEIDDGRSYVRRSEEKYSSIQATLVDTWAAASAGAFTLSENNLYTSDAFQDYLQHLKPNGVLSMTRWFGNPPIEFLRVLALGREALTRLGVPESEHAKHFFVAADNRMATLLLKRDAYTDDELKTLQGAVKDAELRVLYSPDAAVGGQVPILHEALTKTPKAFYDAQTFDVSPTTDDRPFFFYTVRWKDFAAMLGNLTGIERNNLGLVILQVVLILSLALTFLLVVVPLLVFDREALRERRGHKVRILLYFLSLGLGFIVIELGLMQRLTLFLGQPLYALALVLATLLGASGVGSALSGQLAEKWTARGAVPRVVGVLIAILAVYLFALGPLLSGLLALPLFARALVAVILVALVGLPMGTLLPLGVRTLGDRDAALLPWAWGLNGATSVVGSTLAVVVSLQVGFSSTLFLGLLAYGLGALALREPSER